MGYGFVKSGAKIMASSSTENKLIPDFLLSNAKLLSSITSNQEFYKRKTGYKILLMALFE